MSIRGALLIVFCTIAAQAHSPGTAKAFLDELTESQPALTKKLSSRKRNENGGVKSEKAACTVGCSLREEESFVIPCPQLRSAILSKTMQL